MMFCIQACIVEFSIAIGFGEDRLREKGSLPATFFTSIFLKEWKYGDGKKNRVRDYCRF